MNDTTRFGPAAQAHARMSVTGLRDRYARTRARSLDLAQPLSAEDCCAQSMPDASPVKWHLAHTTWFFETFILESHEPDFRPFMPAFRVLFNSYYNGVGEKHPRPQRGLLTRPPLRDVLLYRMQVDERMQVLFDRLGENESFRMLAELGINHEEQHQELILTDVKHLLWANPLRPAYCDAPVDAVRAAGPMGWIGFEAGLVQVGHEGSSFCFDNEMPRHAEYLQAYSLGSRLVTNGEYLRFVDGGGYRDPNLWLSEGWDWVQANQVQHPIYWERNGEQWQEFTLAGLRPLNPDRPAVHIAYYEDDAYARWAGARLPTEAEWENAAAASGLQQMLGEAWQWTRSSYAAYPGFHPATGAIGEYNGKFMVNQYVLRGGSCATPEGHSRATYRNFFPATARWQFSGVRLARDGSATLLG